MPREMTVDAQAALDGTLFRPAIFVEATFQTETLYLWSGRGDISWNGHTWQGLGRLGSISLIEDGVTIEARGIALTLSGIPTHLLADVLQEMKLGAPVNVYLGLFDTSSPPELIADPIVSWAGRMDQPTIQFGGETASLTIACENRLLDMNVAVDRRYTQDDQQMDHPGDLGMQFVAGIQEQTIYWGRVPSSPNNL